MPYFDHDELMHRTLCRTDAEYIIDKYALPCASMLSRLIHGLYCDEAYTPEQRIRSGFDLGRDAAEEFGVMLKSVVEQVHRLERLVSGRFYRGVNLVLNTCDEDDRRDVCEALRSLNDNRRGVRETPLDLPSAFLPDIIGNLSRYLLFVTDQGPVFEDANSNPTAHRRLAADVLALLGWGYPVEQVDEHCSAMQRKFSHAKASQCGLRRSACERAEAVAWREQQAMRNETRQQN
jgi:hypothetical protein